MAGMPIRRKEFLRRIAPGCRIRHRHDRRGSRIIGFTVQLEVLVGKAWKAVVRYDTAHAFAHRDLMRRDGRMDKMPIFGLDYRDVLVFAESDLRANWAVYVRRYLEENGDD